jgi:glycogen operon protein
MIEFRKQYAALRWGQFFTGALNQRGVQDVSWHGTRLNSPGWSDPEARVLGMTLAGFDGDPDIHVMMNMYWESLDFDVPQIVGRRWSKVVDTAQAPPADFAEPGTETDVAGNTCTVAGRSVVVLVNRAGS